MNKTDEKFMSEALRLAGRGIGSVEPNPAVGCVIVKNGRIIGRGWHRKFGGPHAEIGALKDCRKRDNNPAGATMYVTLEPCCHYGKTPPCTDAIIAAGIGRIVAATSDLSKHANSRGLKLLRKAGIAVEVGVCENEATLLNVPFLKFASTGKCWVIVKWAQSKDGKMAWANQTIKKRWISSRRSRQDAHKLRRQVQGILVGIGTVLADDPLLTKRPEIGKQPVRIVLDADLRIPLNSKLIKTAKKSPVLIITSRNVNSQKQKKIVEEGAEILTVPTRQGYCDIKFLLEHLSKRGVAQLLVEGGREVINSFLAVDLADQIVIYIAPQVLGDKGTVLVSPAMAKLSKDKGLYYIATKRLEDDVRISGLTKKAVNELSLV